ncbi:MAG: TRAP transporter small permease subunit [Clostridiales Family XIII bacterium]|nr:TRAP transporter small permease subunit [Clostridiales Family XIII bacterium]
MKTKPWYNRIEMAMMIATFLLLIAIGTANVLTRYFLSYTLQWSEQTLRILFVWLVFAGVSYSGYTDEHIRVNALGIVMKPETAKKVVFGADVFTVAFGVFMTYQELLITLRVWHTGQTFAMLPMVNKAILYLPTFLGFMGMTIRVIQRNVEKRIREKHGEEA